MAERNARTEVLKKLSDGKTLCSEMNNASSNANFLFMRRHDALVLQLESAKQSLVMQNQRAQNEMKKKLDKYKQRKRAIFRDRLVSQPSDNLEESESGHDMRTPTRSTLTSSMGGRSSITSASSLHLPSILSMALVHSSEDNFHSNINKQHKFHRMKRQESLNFQIISSRVYEFCSMLDSERVGGEPFFITTAKRRIAFNDSRPRSRVSSGLAASSRTSSANLTKPKLFREKHRAITAVTS